MFNIKIEVSSRLQKLLDGSFMQRFFLLFGNLFLDEWQKQAASGKYWIGGAAKVLPRKSKTAPHPTMLTVRTGVLRGSLQKGATDSIRNVTVGEDSFKMSLGSRVVYAARQEYQKGGARSYVRRAFEWMKINKVETIKKKVIKEMGW